MDGGTEREAAARLAKLRGEAARLEEMATTTRQAGLAASVHALRAALDARDGDDPGQVLARARPAAETVARECGRAGLAWFSARGAALAAGVRAGAAARVLPRDDAEEEGTWPDYGDARRPAPGASAYAALAGLAGRDAFAPRDDPRASVLAAEEGPARGAALPRLVRRGTGPSA